MKYSKASRCPHKRATPATHLAVAVSAFLALQIVWLPALQAQPETTTTPTYYQEYEVERQPILQNFSTLSANVKLPEGIAKRVLDTRITFRVLVNDRGNYQRHELLSEGEEELSAACAVVLPQAVFQPAVRLNSLVWCWTTVSFRFSFDGSGSNLRQPIAENLTYVRQKIGYPDLARRSGIMGKVVVRVLVNEQGRVGDYELKYNPHHLLTEPVIASLPDLRFLPGAVDGTPTAQWVEIPFDFQLVGLYKRYEFKPNVKADPREARLARKRAKRESRGKTFIEKDSSPGKEKKQEKRQQKLARKQEKREARGKTTAEKAPSPRKLKKMEKRAQKFAKKQDKRGRISLPPITETPKVDTPPMLRNGKRLARKTHYPKIAAVAGRQGRVVVAVYVQPTKKGKSTLLAAQVIACPEADFTLEAIKRVKKARFTPAVKDGEPVGCWVHYVVDFTAEGKSLINADTKRVLLIFKKRIKPKLTVNVQSLLRAEPYN